MLNFLASQQACLKDLGFYKGELHGVWDEATAAAQLAFTSTVKAIPCQATNRPFTKHCYPSCYKLIDDGSKTYFQLDTQAKKTSDKPVVVETQAAATLPEKPVVKGNAPTPLKK